MKELYEHLSRRNFLHLTGGLIMSTPLVVTLATQAQSDNPSEIKKAIQWNNLPKDKSEAERCQIAKECGFDGIELPPLTDSAEIDRIVAGAQTHGLTIHSIIYGGWGKPLSHPNPSVAEEGKADIRKAIDLAQRVGAEVVLLVPAVVTEQVRYEEAWTRSQQHIRDLIPYAEEKKVIIAVENVWNKFLLSPLEFRQYIDEINSPYVRAYFDMANVVIFGYPQDWIRTLGNRIVRLHIKDFKRDGYQWCSLPYEGDVNFTEVRKALREIGYSGWVTEEFPGGDIDYLTELAKRIDKFIHSA